MLSSRYRLGLAKRMRPGRPWRMRIHPLIVAALPLLAVLHGCTAMAQTTEPDVAKLSEQIQAAVGDAACDDSSQCRTIAIGAKACGGPESYLAWSTLRTDEKRLKAAVDRHHERRQAENRANRMSSTCMMVTDPGAACRAKRCTLNAAGGSVPGRPD